MDIQPKKTILLIENINNIFGYQCPTIQRLLKKEYIEYLVEDQKEEYNKNKSFSMLQSITCVDYNNKRYILDGQHRIEAFKVLEKEGYILNFNLPIIVYNVDSFEEMRRYYTRINKNNPINPLEISDEWFSHGKTYCAWLSNEYKEFIKNTDNSCNCPYINLRELMLYIKNKAVFERCKSRDISIETLINKTEELNDYLDKHKSNISKYQINNEIPKKIDKCVKKKAEKTLYLGIWRQYEWIELLLHVLIEKKNIEDIELSVFQNIRRKIPKTLRMSVWNKRNYNNLRGKCHVCNSELHYEDMECGHIVPHVYGGDIALHNLEPICKTCNRDMGVMNLNEYKKLIN
jgi:hypothetical protein